MKCLSVYSHHQFAASGSCENDDEKFTFLDGVLETGNKRTSQVVRTNKYFLRLYLFSFTTFNQK